MGDQVRGPHATEAELRPYVPDLLRRWPVGCQWQELDGTLVSADITGFTPLTERLAERGREGAEELTAIICGCFEGMIECCAEHGGDIVKFGGDALLVWFTDGGHAQRACRATVGMRRIMGRRRTMSNGKLIRLSLSIGVHTGQHHFFAIRCGRDDLIVSGPGATATIAGESAAAVGEILLSHATAATVPATWLGASRSDGVTLQRLTTAQRRTAPVLDAPQVERPSRDFVSEVQQAQVIGGAVNEHRQAAIAFVAFTGSDALIESGRADEVSVRLRAVGSSIAAASDRYGVFLLESGVHRDGGKFLLAAGAPLSLGGDDERMLRAVREIVDADPGLQLHAGITRGYVFGCDLGSEHRRGYTLMGDAVNLAARLMAKAGPGEVIVNRPAIEWASSRFEYESLEPFFVKGKSVPVYAGRLGRHLGRRTDFDQVDTEIFGRDREMARLLELAAATIDGHGSVVVITGEPGIGKSRLAVEVVRQHRGLEVVLVRCQPFDRLTPYSVARPILRSLLGIDLEASSRDAGAALVAWLSEHAPDAVPLSPLLAIAVEADIGPTAEADAVLPAFRRVRTLQLLSDLIVGAVVTPTAILIEDVNHADDATRELIEVLATSAADVPLLLVATSVPEERLPGERVGLGQLDPPAVVAVIDALLGNRAIAPSTVRAIAHRAEGNPLFVGELVRCLAEDPDAEVPPTLEALVEARIDTLAPADLRLLRNASVLGVDVDITLLGQMSDDSLIRRQDRWDRLDRFLERVGPDVVRFRYDTYHRVVYGGLSYATRRILHRRVLDVLERTARAETVDHLARLTYHAHRSGDRERTWRYGAAAAAAAAGAATFGEAARLYTLTLQARVEVPADELRQVAEAAGDVYEIVGRLEAAERALALATRHSPSGVDRSRLWRKRADLAQHSGRNGLASRRLARAARELKTVPWSVAIGEHARWESAKSAVALRQSRPEEAWNHATSALIKAQLVQDWRTAAHAALMVDNLVTNLRWDGVVVQRPDVLELCRRAGDPVGEAKYLSNRAVDHYFDGDWREAMRLYRESAERSAKYGHAVSEATCLNNIAEILSDQGHYDEAGSMFRDASRAWRSVGYGIGIAYADANLGRLATRTGRHTAARELLDAAGARFEALGASVNLTEVALRMIEDHLVAGDAAAERTWPPDSQLAAEPTLLVYADRLRALATDAAAEAERAIDRSIATARAAGVPFELALSLRVRAAIAADGAAADEGSEILRSLEVIKPPPLPRGVCSRI